MPQHNFRRWIMDHANIAERRQAGGATLDLWDAFDDLRREFERSWSGLELSDVSGLLDWPTGPAIDLVEIDDELLLLADLPGVRKDDLELCVQGNLLTIKGEKKREEPTKSRKVVKTESWVGAFNRTVELPDGVDPDKVEAQLRDGILRVRIAKREESKRRTIQVSVK
jgi:HSP20 family protein